MGYHYDPILCMNVPDSASKAKDAKALDDAKADFQKIISLTKQIDDITRRYARKIDANAMFAYTEQIRNKVQYYIDNASRTADKFTVWESDEYDDIYVSYEGGTYVLYVENRPQADGPQSKMIQLAKQEERMRG